MRFDWLVRPGIVLSFIAALLVAVHARAQTRPADSVRIYVLTMQPGNAVWEKFGHNAIWVHDPAGQLDLCYNWGLFDFQKPGFVRNFALGLMTYEMGASYLEDSLAEYERNNRTIRAQELDLSPEQTQKLLKTLAINELPENREYRYNYYTDNCSTRVRDVIDDAVGGQLKAQLSQIHSRHTWRWHTRRLTQDSPLWYTALNTALGPLSDGPLTEWDECFIPDQLHDNLARVKTTDAVGGKKPFVKSERILFQSTRPAPPDAPPEWIAQYAAVGVMVALLNLLLLRWSGQARAGRVVLGTWLTVYAMFIGACGAIGLHFWILTDHWAGYRNENLFAYSPLGLLLAIFIPGLIRRSVRSARFAVLCASTIAALSLLGLIAQITPAFDQVNGEPLALVLPMNLALAWTVWSYRRGHAEKPVPDPAKKVEIT